MIRKYRDTNKMIATFSVSALDIFLSFIKIYKTFMAKKIFCSIKGSFLKNDFNEPVFSASMEEMMVSRKRSSGQDTSLPDAAVDLLAALASCMHWKRYVQLCLFYATKLNTCTEKSKPLVKLVLAAFRTDVVKLSKQLSVIGCYSRFSLVICFYFRILAAVVGAYSHESDATNNDNDNDNDDMNDGNDDEAIDEDEPMLDKPEEGESVKQNGATNTTAEGTNTTAEGTNGTWAVAVAGTSGNEASVGAKTVVSSLAAGSTKKIGKGGHLLVQITSDIRYFVNWITLALENIN